MGKGVPSEQLPVLSVEADTADLLPQVVVNLPSPPFLFFSL